MDKRFQRIAYPVQTHGLKGGALAGLLLLLAGCGDPLAGLRLQDVPGSAVATDDGAALLATNAEAERPDDAATSEEEPAKSGVLGWLFAQKDAPLSDKDAIALPQTTLASKEPGRTPDGDAGAQVQLASLPASTEGATSKDRGGFDLFKLLSRSEPEQPTGAIPFGSSTRFGSVGIVCDFSKRKLGTLVAQHPEKKPFYRLYDSAPSDEGLRAFYVTGFGDGCLRQVMGTAVVFGSVEMHEQLRYGLPSELHPFTTTDKAYEKLKRRLCKVRTKEPCGEQRSKLTPNTVFVSVYDTRGLGQGWANMLLHDGAVLASHHTAE